jgi:hypothetical protein
MADPSASSIMPWHPVALSLSQPFTNPMDHPFEERE